AVAARLFRARRGGGGGPRPGRAPQHAAHPAAHRRAALRPGPDRPRPPGAGARPVLRDVPGGLRPPPVPAVLRRTPPTPVSERNAGCAAGRPRPAPSAPVSAPLPPRPALGRIGAVLPGPAARTAWGGGDVSPCPAGGPSRAAWRPDPSSAVSESLRCSRPVARLLRPQNAPGQPAGAPFSSAPRPCPGTRVPGQAVRLPR